MAEGRRRSGLRKIDGKTFGLASRPMKKEDAKMAAQIVRQQGRLARVLPNKDGNYEVYITNSGNNSNDIRTRTFNRSFPASTTALMATYGNNPTISNNQKKPGFIARLFGARPKANGGISRSEELDMQQIQDYKKILKQIKSDTDFVELTNDEMKERAESLAKQLRVQKETEDRKIIESERLEREARQAKDRLANLRWDQEVATYNEPYPLGQVLKYNSLEIASTGTGALTGWGIAALMGSTAFPIVPIGAGVGYLTAKAARPNLFGLGSATQAVLNSVDYLEKDIITDSIRVSGGFEKEKNADGSWKLDSKGRKITKYPSKGTNLTARQVRVPKRSRPEEVLGLNKQQTKRIKDASKARKKMKE